MTKHLGTTCQPNTYTPSARTTVHPVKPRKNASGARTRQPVDRALNSPELAKAGLCVSLEGTPTARPEPRGGGSRRVVNAPKAVKRYILALERQTKTAVENVGGAEVVRATFGQRPLLVRIVWSFPTKIEDRWGQPHLFKPDVDNLEKLVLDCLKRAGAFGGDDCQVATVQKAKEWDLSGWLWVLIKPLDLNTRAKKGEDVAGLKLAPDWLRK